MARMRGPRFKKSRSLGLNVCGHPKAMKRMKKGDARDDKKLSPYGVQLLEKQRLRAYYEVMEKQFKNYVKTAMKSDDKAGTALVIALESRLDNLVYRAGFASSIRQARQMVVHGHIKVNGKKVDRPSFNVKVNDVISLREKSRQNQMFKDNFNDTYPLSIQYLVKNLDDYSATYSRLPKRDEVPIQIDDTLVVEYYSKIL